MSDKDAKTEVKDDKTENFEKRYNDSQTHIATIEQENKDLRTAGDKDKELFDAVSQYIDWDAVNGKKTATEAVDDDGYVDKKTLTKAISDLQGTINKDRATTNFRTKYPDMVPYEDLVATYFQKTNPRDTTESRIAKAVENVKTLMESERAKGRDEKKQQTAKEAEAGGLSGGKGPEGEKETPKGETREEYFESRSERLAKTQGLT